MIFQQFRSLRVRLAILGFFTLVVIIIVALSLLMVTDEITVDRIPGSSAVDIEERTTVSPLVIFFAFLLAFPIALVAWWWAGRAVNPINEMSRLIDLIQSGSLDQRIELTDAVIELQTLADHFNNMLDRLAAQSRIQQQLIEEISHDLRTPLAVLSTNSDVILADTSANLTDYRASAELTSRTVLKLRKTIEELLANARFNNYTTGKSNNDLSSIVTQVVAVFHDAANAKGVQLKTKAPAQLFCAIDGMSVSRALSNLVDNAIRFSSKGNYVVIEAGVDKAMAYLSVTDQGLGILPAHQERMFERYWSTDNTNKHNHGIGLSIVKQVADAHKGLSVLSPIDAARGTCITLWFQINN